MERERIEHYAQCRANETGRPYVITSVGHVWMDCPFNRKLAKTLDMPFIRVLPNYTTPKPAAQS